MKNTGDKTDAKKGKMCSQMSRSARMERGKMSKRNRKVAKTIDLLSNLPTNSGSGPNRLLTFSEEKKKFRDYSDVWKKNRHGEKVLSRILALCVFVVSNEMW